MYRSGGGSQISQKKCYEGVRFNIIGVTKRWMVVKFQETSIRQHWMAAYWMQFDFQIAVPRAMDVIIDIFNSWFSMISYCSNDKNESSFPQHALGCVSIGSRQFLDCCGY